MPDHSPTGESESGTRTEHSILGAAALLIAVQLALRGWALHSGWFYLDDFLLLDDAARSDLSLAYLTEPHDAQYMPFGRLIAWLVAAGGLVNWPLAVMITLALQLAASTACLWMLVTLFGVRLEVLLAFSLYLFSAMTMSSTMWWAASLNLLPLQITFFVAVGAWVQYLRGNRRWLGVAILALMFGIAAYVKTLVLFPVLFFVAFAWFSEGSLRHRLRQGARNYWLGLIGCVALSVGFLAYYVTQVPQITSRAPWEFAGPLANTMLGESLSVGVFGGPWQWSRINPPAGLADPPEWLIQLAWVAIALLAAYWGLRRERSRTVWMLVAGYAAMSYLLLLFTRAPVVGAVAGLEYRYLADVTCAMCLCVGVMMMPLLGAPSAPRLRSEPRLRLTASVAVVVAIAVVVGLSGVFSSITYARIWHEDNPPEDYLKRAQSELNGRGPVDIADTAVPDEVLPGYLFPFNTTSHLLPVVVDNARFPTVTSRLAVLDTDGSVTSAEIDTSTTSLEGPDPGCGWEISGPGSVTIPLAATAFDFTWWVRIGYLGSRDDSATIKLGDASIETRVRRGLHNIYLNVTEEISHVTIGGLSPGSTMCVDLIEVGLAVPGDPYEA